MSDEFAIDEFCEDLDAFDYWSLIDLVQEPVVVDVTKVKPCETGAVLPF